MPAARVAATVFFTGEEVVDALSTIRGSVNRHESIVMAAAAACASSLATGGRIETGAMAQPEAPCAECGLPESLHPSHRYQPKEIE